MDGDSRECHRQRVGEHLEETLESKGSVSVCAEQPRISARAAEARARAKEAEKEADYEAVRENEKRKRRESSRVYALKAKKISKLVDEESDKFFKLKTRVEADKYWRNLASKLQKYYDKYYGGKEPLYIPSGITDECETRKHVLLRIIEYSETQKRSFHLKCSSQLRNHAVCKVPGCDFCMCYTFSTCSMNWNLLTLRKHTCSEDDEVHKKIKTNYRVKDFARELARNLDITPQTRPKDCRTIAAMFCMRLPSDVWLSRCLKEARAISKGTFGQDGVEDPVRKESTKPTKRRTTVIEVQEALLTEEEPPREEEPQRQVSQLNCNPTPTTTTSRKPRGRAELRAELEADLLRKMRRTRKEGIKPLIVKAKRGVLDLVNLDMTYLRVANRDVYEEVKMAAISIRDALSDM